MLIKEQCDQGEYDVEIEENEITDELRKTLKDNGYKINKLHPSQFPDDPIMIQISWD